MGVKNLLPHLRSIVSKTSLREFAGKIVGIDAKSWLYRAAMTSRPSAQGQVTASMLGYLTKRIALLISCGVVDAIFVFDGCECAAKAHENQRRSQLKDLNFQKAVQAEDAGDMTKAEAYYRQCVHISFEQVQAFVRLLREHHLPYLVAPYEADAQLAHFSKIGAIEVAISEDSDLLAYGCAKVLYKVDAQGEGDLIAKTDLSRNAQLCFQQWTELQFLTFCCLCGCDYLPSLPGIGIKKAHQLVSRHASVKQICAQLQGIGGQAYCAQLMRALWTYQHHLVYDVECRRLVHLNALQEGAEWAAMTAEHCLGPSISDQALLPLVKAEIDPKSIHKLQEQPAQGEVEHEEELWGFDVQSMHMMHKHQHRRPAAGGFQWISPDDPKLSHLPDMQPKKRRRRGPAELPASSSFCSPLISNKFAKLRRPAAPLPVFSLSNSNSQEMVVEEEVLPTRMSFFDEDLFAEHQDDWLEQDIILQDQQRQEQGLWSIQDEYDAEVWQLEEGKQQRLHSLFGW